MTIKDYDDMETKLIKVAVADGIAVVTMDHPPVNAQNANSPSRWPMSSTCCRTAADVRAVVLTGAGKVFSAGADLKDRPDKSKPGERWQHNRRARESYHAIRECTKPVIAAINGAALGAGLALAASCDILLCADEAVLGLPEIDVGLLGGGKHTQRLFPHSTLRRMMLTGYRVPGPELYRLGVVEASVPRAELMERALDVARRDRWQEPGGYPARQAHAEHHRGHDTARRLPLRAKHDDGTRRASRTPPRRKPHFARSGRQSFNLGDAVMRCAGTH